MRELLTQKISDFLCQYCEENAMDSLWRTPLVGFADARAAGFGDLRRIVDPEHFLPQELLADATIVLSYFLPFRAEIAASNLGGRSCSEAWANAYVVTNRMVKDWLNPQLVEAIGELGAKAVVPQGTGILSEEKLWSRWSQRHVAYLAGLGSFGLNNLLLSERGSCGRYFSLITTLDVAPMEPQTEERCLYKRNGSCGECVRRCPTGALRLDGFDRAACYALCLENEAKYPEADACGKCDCGLPCSIL